MEIVGKYNTLLTMIDTLDESVLSQLYAILNEESFKGSKIRIMSDCHAGKGCVVGFTAKVSDKIIPNLVGVDISCTVSATKLDINSDNIDFEKLDKVIRNNIPSGSSVRESPHELIPVVFANNIEKISKEIGDYDNLNRHLLSLGTLGGGNHFISVEVDENNKPWLLVHCGSRNFGHKICQYHQKKAFDNCRNIIIEKKKNVINIPEKERQSYLESLKDINFNKDFAYLEGKDLEQYINHVEIAKRFTKINHTIIIYEILSHMYWSSVKNIFTNHNYIEQLKDGFMIRKGAVSAKKDEVFVLPLNMRDGSLICIGKGNDEWNQSAPHGAGRLMSRSQAKKEIDFEDFKESMKNVWSTSIKLSTIDEAPFVYKNYEDIINSLNDVADIKHHLKPIYNYKDN